MSTDAKIMIYLTHDQALVLFEWLAREDENGNIPIGYEAEQRILWEIESQLEKKLLEPLQPDYAALVSAARERLISEDEL